MYVRCMRSVHAGYVWCVHGVHGVCMHMWCMCGICGEYTCSVRAGHMQAIFNIHVT